MQDDTYNRLITKPQIEQAYRTFKSIMRTFITNTKNNHNKKSIKLIQNKQNQHKLTQQQLISSQILSTQLNSPFQRVINLDCQRTRSVNFNQQLKRNLQYFLTYFVKQHNIQYKQGLNEIAAPFILFNSIGIQISQCYQMFIQFFNRFSLNFYYDKNFHTGLQMFFRMISIVLKYHQPELSRYLQFFDIQPQIYAVGWLMTLFSSKLSLRMTYLLWEYMFLQNDKYLLFFIVVAIIIYRKQAIIQTQNSSVFKIVTDMIFKNEQQLLSVIRIALILIKNTPSSLKLFFEQRKIFDRTQNQSHFKQSAQIIDHINQLNLFLILAKQIYEIDNNYNNNKYYNNIKNRVKIQINQIQTQSIALKRLIYLSNDIDNINNKLKFLLVDLRKQKYKLNNQHMQLYQIFKIEIKKPFQHIQTQFLNQNIQKKGNYHFVLLLTTFTFQDVTFSDQQQLKCANKLIKVLNSYSFSNLGILEGGYKAIQLYEEQLKIKKQLNRKNFIKQQNYYQQNQNQNNNNCKIISTQNIKLSIDCLYKIQSLSISLSIMYQLFNLRKFKQINIFYGEQKIFVLLTQCFIIIVEDIQGFTQFASNIQHNCSLLMYFYKNFKQIKIKIVKILELYKIKQIGVIKDKQNKMVIKYKHQIKLNSQHRKNMQNQYLKIIENHTEKEKLLENQKQLTENKYISLQEIKNLCEQFLLILKATQFQSYQNYSNSKNNLASPNNSSPFRKQKESAQNSPIKQQKNQKSDTKIFLTLKQQSQVKQLSLAIEKRYKYHLYKKQSMKQKQISKDKMKRSR